MAGAGTGVDAKPTPIPRDQSCATVHHRFYKGRGDSMLQISWRAILMGSVLGGALWLTNLSFGLKAGGSFGGAIAAGIKNFHCPRK